MAASGQQALAHRLVEACHDDADREAVAAHGGGGGEFCGEAGVKLMA